MIDALNSNKEYKLVVRFSRGGTKREDLINTLIRCINEDDVLIIDSEDEEVAKLLSIQDITQSSDNDVIPLVMGLTRLEQKADSDALDPSANEEYHENIEE